MRLQVVHFHQWYVLCECKSFGETRAYQQTAQQPWSACKGNCAQLVCRHTCAFEGGIHYGYDVQLMCTAGKFGDDATELLMYALRSGHIAQQYAVFEDCRRGIIAT